MNRNFSIKKIVLISILAGMSFILFMFPKFPLFAAFPWLDMDLSDVPALFASIVISPLSGLTVALIKNTIHLAVTSTAMVGELSNFLINGTFVFAAGLLYKYFFKNKCFGTIIASVLLAIIAQLFCAILVNYFIMIPMYSAFVNFDELGGAKTYIIAGVIPFNFIKDILTSFVFILLYKVISHKNMNILSK